MTRLFETQLDLYRTLGIRALDSAGQLTELNIHASRMCAERAAATFTQLLMLREPRDLFALGAAAQQHWHALFAYGRDLARLAAPAPDAPPAPQADDAAALPAFVQPQPAAQIAQAAPAAQPDAALGAAPADAVPPAAPTLLARALQEAAPRQAAVEHPLASPLPLEAASHVELPQLTPPESIAPPIARPPRASRAARKK